MKRTGGPADGRAVKVARRMGRKAGRGWVWMSALLAAHLSGLSASALAGQAPTSLTLYNDGRVLVRRLLTLDLKKGESDQRLPLGPVDPASIFPLDDGVSFVNARYDAAVDEQSVLRRAVGRRLTFRSGKDTVSAELVGVDPERYRLADGSISFVRPGIPQYPAELVALEPTLRVLVSSAAARRDLRVGYFTQGGGWSAAYQVILGGAGGTARVMGQAVINGGPLTFRDVELQLLAGQVNVATPEAGFSPRMEAMRVAAKSIAAEAPAEQKVGEFHLYTLPGRGSLEPGSVTTVGLFEPATARVSKSFEVHGQIPYWGGLPQYGEENEAPVSVIYTILRPRKTDLGDRPMPGGVVRLFEPDSAGRVQLIGEAAIGHSPAGEDLRLPAGTAFDLTAKRVQLNYTTRRDSIPGGGWRTVATADYRVTLQNGGDTAATIDVIEERGGEWSVVSSSVKPDRRSSTRTAFRVSVPARGRTTLTYRVRVIW
jgi:hypothetical protein